MNERNAADASEPEEREPTPRKVVERNGSRLKAIGILLGVFLLGGVAGGAAMQARMYRHWSDTMRGPPTAARARFRLEAMQRHLDLSDEQRDKLEVILTDAAEEQKQLMDDCRPALDALRDRTDARIREVLTPEQQAKHEEMMKQMRDRRGPRGGRGFHGPPRHGGPPGPGGP